jgi:hypothetical protein
VVSAGSLGVVLGFTEPGITGVLGPEGTATKAIGVAEPEAVTGDELA